MREREGLESGIFQHDSGSGGEVTVQDPAG